MKSKVSLRYVTRFAALLCGLTFFLACSSSSDDDDSSSSVPLSQNACGVIGLNNARINAKIIAGTECQVAPSPVVLLDLGVGLCTGTMITREHVLTAGHCFILPEARRSSAVLLNRSSSPIAFGAELIVHPGFGIEEESNLIVNDLAIIRLDRALDLPTLPIFLSRNIRSGDRISIFGFGQATNENNTSGSTTAGILRSGEMRVSAVDNSYIFAEFGDEGSNTCFGDSGGPAILTERDRDGNLISAIVGVTSTGTSDTCSRGDNSNFANLQSSGSLDFINQVAPGVRVF
jgi:secreted trypsin-like serine protease